MSRRRSRAALTERLRALGAQTPATPDPARLDTTEARLRAIFDAHGGEAPTPLAIADDPGADDADADALGRVGARRRRLAVSGAVFIAAAGAIAAFAVLIDDPTADTALRLTAAENAYVVLADGSRIAATPGITIPAGGRLEVGAGGSATIDGHTLGPGESATVDDGEVAVSPSRSEFGPGDTDPDGSTPGSAPAGSGDTTGAAGSPSTEANDPPATTAPAAATTTSTTRPAATTTTTRPASTTTTSPAPTVQPLRARAVVDGAVVHLTWEPYAGSDFAAYLVVARTDGLAPLPGREGNVVLFRTDRRRVVARDIRMRDGLAVRIVVVDTKGRIVAASKVFRPGTDPRTGTATTTTTTTTPPTTTPPTTTTVTTTLAPTGAPGT